MNANLGDPPFLLSCSLSTDGGIVLQFIHPSLTNPLIWVPFVITSSDADKLLGVLKQVRAGDRSYFCESFPVGRSLETSLEFDRRHFTFGLEFSDPENACIIIRFESTVSDDDLDTIGSLIEAALTTTQ